MADGWSWAAPALLPGFDAGNVLWDRRIKSPNRLGDLRVISVSPLIHPRDREIIATLLRRQGTPDPMHVERLATVNRRTRRFRLAEVFWAFEHEGFQGAGSCRPEMPARREAFHEHLREVSFDVFCGETCVEAGIDTSADSITLENHRIALFAIDLATWTISPLDDEVYAARRSHPAAFERWFAVFQSSDPTPRLVERLTQHLCQVLGILYAEPLARREVPCHPAPEPEPVPCAVRRRESRASPSAGAPPSQPGRPSFHDEAFLASVREARALALQSPNLSPVTLWWLGQSSFLVHWHGHFLILDPCLSNTDPRNPRSRGPEHARLTRRVIAPDRLDFIDLVSVSHHEPDHLDAGTLRALARVNPGLELICPERFRDLARKCSCLPAGRVHGIDPQLSGCPGYPQLGPHPFQSHGFHFRPVLASRGASTPPSPLRYPPMGMLIERDGLAIYQGSHALLSGQAVEELSAWEVSVALLPINGRENPDDPAGNYWGDEAALLARDLEAQLVIPCHYDTFAFETVSPEAFIRSCETLGQACEVLQPGQAIRLQIT